MKRRLLLSILVLCFVTAVKAQCTLTGSPNVNSSAITCSTFSGCTTIYIGDGTNPTNLVMNQNLNLSCYGVIQFVIRNNANIDFSNGNYDMTLAAGSSIVIENGGNISAGSNCSASDLIKIGSIKVASCNGSGGAITDFPTLVNDGGFNVVIASATAVCGSGTSTITASQNPAPTSSTTFKFYTVASGGTPVYTTTASSSPYTVTYTTPTISASTTYYVEAVTVSSGATTPRKAVAITVNPLPAAPTVSTTQPTCTVATGTITISNPTGSGMTYSINGTTYTNTTGIFSGLNAGTYNVTAKSAAGCISSATSAVINAQPFVPAQPTLGSLAQPTCTIATGTFSITNYNASYTYTASPSTGVTISGSSVTAPSGTYTITATSGSCSSVASNSIVISSQPTNTWNGSVWSNGAPTSAQKLVFSGNYSSTGNVAGCSCQVTSGNVTFNSGHTLNVVYDVKVTGGSLTFANNASLVQTDDTAVNSGNITYVRTTRPMTRWAYVYWGSPVEGNVFGQIPTQFDLGYRWQSGTMNGSWMPLSATSLGEGFITRVRNIAPFNSGTGTVNFSFIGKPNNGVINVNVDSYDSSSMVAGNTVLLANPYPSAIDAAKFLQHANNTELGGTLFFWTAVTYYAGSGAYNIQDYGSWNLTGGTAPVSSSSLVPNGKIAAGQGFFSQVFADGTISFNNAMRESGNNTQFFRMSNTTESSEDAIVRNRIWLNLSGESTLRQTLLGYVSNATNDFDRLYDGDSFTSNEIDVYSVLENRKLVIQGRALPFTDTDIVPIGYRVTTAGNYSLSMADADGIFAEDQNVYLYDKTTGLYHDIKASAYTFNTAAGTFDNRFELRYTTETLGVNHPTVSENDVKVVSNTNGISVYCNASAITKVEMFDVSGKLLYRNNTLNTNVLESVSVPNTRVLLVKVTLDTGMTYTKKTLIQ
ncbi:Ig-like domain-containing protein [Flavobacterium sp.]|uniref:Ig-like domain-containing protein n=1 Tax=Flavobacterium sp. TaxID=239 RepID=UPI002FDEF63E